MASWELSWQTLAGYPQAVPRKTTVAEPSGKPPRTRGKESLKVSFEKTSGDSRLAVKLGGCRVCLRSSQEWLTLSSGCHD